MTESQVLAVPLALFGVTGWLFVYLGWLGRQGRLRPNPWAGIRTPFTMSSAENWYRSHRAAAPVLIAAGMAQALFGLALAVAALVGWLPAPLAVAASLMLAAAALVGTLGAWLVGMWAAKSR